MTFIATTPTLRLWSPSTRLIQIGWPCGGRITHRPGGYFLAPEGDERIGDVSNVTFSNGWIADDDGSVFIYYGSSDTRTHVATSSLERLLDYVTNTPPDGLRSAANVALRKTLIRRNLKLLGRG